MNIHMVEGFFETCLLGVFQIVNEMKTQEDLAKLEDLVQLSKEVVASGTASSDIYITLTQQEPGSSDVKENEIVDLNSDLSKEVHINGNSSSSRHAITIKPESSPVCYSCATCLEEFSCETNLKRHVKAQNEVNNLKGSNNFTPHAVFDPIFWGQGVPWTKMLRSL